MSPPAPALHRIGHDTPVAWPLHDSATSRALEQQAAAALPPHTLIQRAGAATARLARALAPHARRYQVLAGPGNNGGDGFEAALGLRRAGAPVQVWAFGDAARLPADAAASLARAREAGVPIHAGPWVDDDLGSDDLLIDALLGLGPLRPVQGAIAAAMVAMNRSAARRLAVDLPSGLPADSGWLAPGALAVRADHTLSLLSLKPGLFTGAGRDHAGEVWFCDLGVTGAAPTAWLAGAASAWLAGAASARLPMRRHAQHKGSFGDLAVVGGATGMAGAAWLAARSALRRGAGRVFVQMLDEAAPALDAAMPELMVRRSIAWQGGDWTVVCGCGGGHAVAAVLPVLLDQVPRLLLDADALNAVAADEGLRAALQARAARGQASVLTPHPLEAARLLGCGVADVQADRLGQASRLARQTGSVVLLKGSGSVTATPAGVPTLNPTGNAALATAGTGDVLAGWIGALWAQGLDAVAACIAAAHQHGAAADRWAAALPPDPAAGVRTGLHRALRAGDL